MGEAGYESLSGEELESAQSGALVRAAFSKRDDAGAILRRRFAKGEISQAEFESAKRILGS